MVKLVLLATIMIALVCMMSMAGAGQPAKKAGPRLAHAVFFSLKDNSPAEVQKLVDACNKYLTRHDGEITFAVGTLAKDLKREVNDQDFDVALHVVFTNKEAHDKYQTHERHLQFIKEMTGKYKKVRVFDSYVSK